MEGMVMRTANDWLGRRVLVTGATGIVGSWLVKHLLACGAQVFVLIRDWDPQSELIRSGAIQQTGVVNAALEDFRAIERTISENETDTVFHLGAQPIVGTALRSPLQTFESNIRGTYHVLEACRIHAGIVRGIVVASSDKAYGESPNLPYTEDMPASGQNPYDVSKSCADLLARAYALTYGLPVGIARCGNIYGGGDLNWSRIVPGTIRSLLHRQRPVVRSDGTYLRDYLYVKDAVAGYQALACALEDPQLRGHAFNFGPGVPVSVLDLVGSIRSLMNAEDLKPIVANNAQGEIRNQYLDCSKAARLLDWRPQRTLRDGLAETIAWYSSYFNMYATASACGTFQ
jgi:CDP-glucose 4,6-dehydratase